MPERQLFIDRVKGAERECCVVAAAVNHYRNDLVHDRDDLDPADVVAIDVARRRLNTLLGCLPDKW